MTVCSDLEEMVVHVNFLLRWKHYAWGQDRFFRNFPDMGFARW